MSLLKLLSAGRSLDGSKPMPSPYRMKSSKFLPKFGSPKNPFARKAEAAKTDAKTASGRMETESLFEAEAKPTPEPEQKAPPAKETKAAVEPEKKIEPKAMSAAPAAPIAPVAPTVPATPVAPVLKEAKPGKLAGWLKKLNPAAYLPKRQPGARAARPKAARTAVQGELSLEKVRVLRNELNDSDLEFVTVKPVANTGTAGTILSARPRPRLTTWGRLTSRVLNTVETQ